MDESHDITREANGTASTAADIALYQHAFWDKEVAPKRKLLISLLLLPLLYTTLLMWLCLSIYWGSLVDSNNVGKIKVLVANLDTGNFLGDQIAAGIQNDIATNTNHLDWEIDSSLQSAADCQNAISDEQAWAILFSTVPTSLFPIARPPHSQTPSSLPRLVLPNQRPPLRLRILQPPRQQHAVLRVRTPSDHRLLTRRAARAPRHQSPPQRRGRHAHGAVPRPGGHRQRRVGKRVQVSAMLGRPVCAEKCGSHSV